MHGGTMTTIEDILRKNGVNFQPIDISHISFLMSLQLPDKVQNYLQCMGTTIKYHETNRGSAWTTLYNIKDLVEHQHPACNKNNLLVIGNGLNGDLLTINLKNTHIGYVFHDDLCEENYLNIEDIYCELPFDIEVFLKMVLEGKTYPMDGTMAEEMKL